jgi:Flp pilus assembly protein protease CpaA
MNTAFVIIHVCIFALAVAAAVVEVRTGAIPNVLPLLGLVGAAGIAATQGSWLDQLLGFFAAFVFGFIAWRREFIGGGAFKWFVAASAMTGLEGALLLGGLFIALLGALWLRARARSTKDGYDVPIAPILAIGLTINALCKDHWLRVLGVATGR